MDIKILFDNRRLHEQFLIGWGVSYLIDNRILFDTGENADFLFDNMDRMGIDMNDIETIVISHEHFDHTGGLWEILRRKPRIDLYICGGSRRGFKEKAQLFDCNIKEVDSFASISGNIFTTGQMEADYGFDRIIEQALVLDTDKGLTVVTGCAHPGIVTMLEEIRKQSAKEIHLVMGGFHLIDKSFSAMARIVAQFKKMGVQRVGPAHCTGEDAADMFRGSFGGHFVDVRVGKTIEV